MSRVVGMRAVGLMLLALAPLACSDNGDGTGVVFDVEGDYALASVNGDPLPFLIGETGGVRAELVSEVLRFETDGTFRDISEVDFTESGTTTTEVDTAFGTWTKADNDVTIDFGGGDRFTGVAGETRITFNTFGTVLVFQKPAPAP